MGHEMPATVCYALLQELLYITEEKQIHPELAAVLMQEVRMQLAMVEQGVHCPVLCRPEMFVFIPVI